MNREKKDLLEDPIHIILHGFGSVLGQVMVGSAIQITKRNVHVLVRDGDEEYVEMYSKEDGIRLNDKGEDSGWQINLSDLVSKDNILENKDVLRKSLDNIKLLHREKHSINDDENLVVEVWHDSNRDERYAKFFRQKIDGGRQQCFFVPFQLMKRVIADFEIDWNI